MLTMLMTSVGQAQARIEPSEKYQAHVPGPRRRTAIDKNYVKFQLFWGNNEILTLTTQLTP